VPKIRYKISIEKRLLDDQEDDLPKWARVLDPKQWSEDIQNHLTFGETEIRNFSTRLCINERERRDRVSGNTWRRK
jgi:hypothetical protein